MYACPRFGAQFHRETHRGLSEVEASQVSEAEEIWKGNPAELIIAINSREAGY
jgi:hypothetical protein